MMPLVSVAAADTLITTDGKTYEGRLVRRTAAKIVFEVVKYGVAMPEDFLPQDVREIRESKTSPGVASKPAKTPSTQPASGPAKTSSSQPASGLTEIPLPPPPPIVKYDGPTYCVIPLHGEIGTDIVSSVVDDAFKDIQKRNPTAVILEMDSPGGNIEDVPALVKVIQKYRDFRMAVLIKEATGAAAMTALSFKEIYIMPGSVIGADSYYIYKPLPKDVEEKFRSIWRATARTSSELGGHQPFLGEAMIEAKNLVWVTEGGKRICREEEKKAGRKNEEEVFLENGALLSLSAGDAVDVGLAKGAPEDYKALGKMMGLGKWRECECYAPILMEVWASNFKRAQKEFDRLETEINGKIKQAETIAPARGFSVIRPRGKSACMKYLAKASEALDALAALTQKYPQLLDNPQSIRQRRDEIEAIKTRIQTSSKQGPGNTRNTPGPESD